MQTTDAVSALSALAQETRLQIFRLLVEAGPDGLAIGHIAEQLGLAPDTLTFHFDRLRTAGLVAARCDGGSMIYAARHDATRALFSFLTANCCKGSPAPAGSRPAGVRNNPREDAMKRFHRHLAVVSEGCVEPGGEAAESPLPVA